MPIHAPGNIGHRGRRKKASKRSVVAVLSLTAMVDMFTVLVVFLLQNFASTGEILQLPDEVNLPAASAVKELKPSNVVLISEEKIMLNNTFIANFNDVKQQADWDIPLLKTELQKIITEGEENKKSLRNTLQKAVSRAKNETQEEKVDEFRKVTIQADKEIDFLTLKKVMYTVNDSGIYEMNFAVIKKPGEEE